MGFKGTNPNRMLPKKLLSLMSNVLRDDELRMAFGNDPVSLIPCKSKCWSFCEFKQDGNNPKSKFWERSIIGNALTPHGIWTLKKLLLKLIVVCTFKLWFPPIHLGMLLDMWLLLKSMYTKYSKGTTGKEPMKWLLLNSKPNSKDRLC